MGTEIPCLLGITIVTHSHFWKCYWNCFSYHALWNMTFLYRSLSSLRYPGFQYDFIDSCWMSTYQKYNGEVVFLYELLLNNKKTIQDNFRTFLFSLMLLYNQSFLMIPHFTLSTHSTAPHISTILLFLPYPVKQNELMFPHRRLFLPPPPPPAPDSSNLLLHSMNFFIFPLC